MFLADQYTYLKAGHWNDFSEFLAENPDFSATILGLLPSQVWIQKCRGSI